MAIQRSINRVYFVGAGFSAGMGYPVGQGLLPRLLDWLENRGRKGVFEHRQGKYAPIETAADTRARRQLVARIHAFLSEYMKPFDPAKSRGTSRTDDWVGRIPVSSFFSVCQAISENAAIFDAEIKGKTKARAYEGLYSEIIAAIRTYFLDLSLIGRTRRPRFAGQIFGKQAFPSKSAAVVNFNWDEELDALLSGAFGVDYTLEAWRNLGDDDGTALMLKPHGSVGWYDVGVRTPTTNKPASRLKNRLGYYVASDDPRISAESLRIRSFYNIEMPISRGGKRFGFFEAPPAIASPTFAKKFEFAEQQLIWSDVVTACSRAKEFVFLGYTLPPDDYLTRAALAKALSNKRAGDDIKCLVIGRDIDKSFDDFQRSFGGGLDRGRHFRNWTFGFSDSPNTFPSKHLGDAIEDELEDARIAR